MSRATSSALIAGREPDLEARDPEFIRRHLMPAFRALSSLYFRADVEGLERVPDGPVLLVGNHSGGLLTPDTIVTVRAWHDRFTVERPLYALAHAMATGVPVIGEVARRFGALTAGQDAARAALDRGASVLVYPGGDREVYRPWPKRHRIDFDGRTGFLHLAHAADVPIVPVVAEGGHDTLMVLSDGRRLARWLRLDRVGRVKVLPVSLGVPFGLAVAGFPPHVPLPVKIRVAFLDPIDLRERLGTSPTGTPPTPWSPVACRPACPGSRLAASCRPSPDAGHDRRHRAPGVHRPGQALRAHVRKAGARGRGAGRLPAR